MSAAVGAASSWPRVLALLVLFTALALLPPLMLGLRASQPQSALASLVAAGFVLFGVRAASSAQVQLDSAAAQAIALLAVLSPLLGATEASADVGLLLAAWPCALLTAGVAGVAAIGARLTLGRMRRTGHGAQALLGASAAMVGALASGLHCALEDAWHLGGHVLAAALVGLGLRRVLLAGASKR